MQMMDAEITAAKASEMLEQMKPEASLEEFFKKKQIKLETNPRLRMTSL